MTNPDDSVCATNGHQGQMHVGDHGSSLVIRPQSGIPGITKREYFAGLAMQGILSSCPEGMPNAAGSLPYKAWAIASVEMADALILELNRTAKP